MKSIPACISASCLAISLVACNNGGEPAGSTPSQPANTLPPPASFQVNLVNTYPHDTSSYTQGYVVYKGQLLEGTGGKPGDNPYESRISKIDLPSGKANLTQKLSTAYFGEGITVFNDKLYQLTWREKAGFIYDPVTLKKTGEFQIKTEGWGLTHDSTNLILSDGSSNLYFLNPENFTTSRILTVSDQYGPVNNLNELEFINGYIYANRWQTNFILKIDPSNGQVVGKADLSTLLDSLKQQYFKNTDYNNGDAVLNGIAYDAASGKIYITGKLWPVLFEVSFN
ncbi:glutaminyl-peptide cyclotransferase [Flavihumibacter sp. UBA7668]|uniref:glutaminyl-peptide cyclotransferase n=1 Tax=Flavihumibacter sp. UBA7668 TaxID=1946542 RepID=UPI0025B9CA2E|nr:glutaminyl-peptide cyclotransferase [Flavihumibacter sp. UBA7668]